jgi:GTP-binding protein
VSAAHPKIADYPCTTKTPGLGIVKTDDFKSFVMVDIPGLIEGAHEGKGMGKAFLRHVERCRVILYLIDVSSPDPAADYHVLKNELLHYDPILLERPSVLVLTKCDLIENAIDGVDQALMTIHEKTAPISAVKKVGLGKLMEYVTKALK